MAAWALLGRVVGPVQLPGHEEQQDQPGGDEELADAAGAGPDGVHEPAATAWLSCTLPAYAGSVDRGVRGQGVPETDRVDVLLVDLDLRGAVQGRSHAGPCSPMAVIVYGGE